MEEKTTPNYNKHVCKALQSELWSRSPNLLRNAAKNNKGQVGQSTSGRVIKLLRLDKFVI